MGLAEQVTNLIQGAFGAPTELPLDQQTIMAAAVLDDLKRVAAQRRAWDAFNGLFPDPLKMRPGDKVRDIVKVNRIRRIVLAGVHFLFGAPPAVVLPKMPGPAGADGQPTQVPHPAQAWL